MDNKTFKQFVESLKELINGMVEEYGVKPVYSAGAENEAEYWNDVKACIDDGEKWLMRKMSRSSKNLDRHKYSALLLAVLIRRPLFDNDNSNKSVDYSNKSVGHCSAGIHFAWKASLYLLGVFIKDNGLYEKRYAEYIKKNGVSLPSDEYVYETLRTFQTLFRSMKEEKKPEAKPPFQSMLPNLLNCEAEVWGFALLFSNIFSLIENNCANRLLLKSVMDERDDLKKKLLAKPQA
jgi:hypothetical protein